MRPADAATRLRKKDWLVRAVHIDVARRMIKREHYAKGVPNTRVYVHGLFRVDAFWDEECQGVTWWIPPTRDAATATHPENPDGVLALSRLAILPDVPHNAASFLLAGSRKLIDRKRWPCLVTYADEMRGHTGAIYLADNWTYQGLTKPEAAYSIRGRLTSRKAGPKTRTHGQMLSLGAVSLGSFAKHKFVHLVAGG
jgi:hypothetical protein